MVLLGHSLLPLGLSFGPRLQAHWLLPEVLFPPTEGSNTWGHRNTKWPLDRFAAKWLVSRTTPASHSAIILHSVVQGCAGITVRVTFCCHRRITCMAAAP